MKDYLKAVWKAWRPFSLTAAVIPTTLGSVLALNNEHFNLITFVLVTIGGILIQSGVNLINDFFEFKSGILPEKNPHLKLTFRNRLVFEYLIFLLGVGCFALTVPIGLFLAYKSGIHLIILGIIGFVGGYFYTGKPFSYKDKSLGVVFVFFLMGVFMVCGSYYAFYPYFPLRVFMISLPVSCLVSLLLISNEIRDIENDSLHGLKTLSVVLGYYRATRLYFYVLSSAYILILLLVVAGFLSFWSILTFLTIPYAFKTYKMTFLSIPQRTNIVPRTANIHFGFGCCLILSLLIHDIAV